MDMTSNSSCVLWDEVTATFANTLYLRDSAAQRVFFEVDKEYNLIVPLRVAYSSIPYVATVRVKEVDEQAKTKRWPLALQNEAINPRTWFNGAKITPNPHSLLESLSEIRCEVQEFKLLHESLYDLSEHEFLKAMATRNHYERILRAKFNVISGVDSSLEQGVAKTVAELAVLDQMVQELHEHHRLNKCQAIMENTNHCLDGRLESIVGALGGKVDRWLCSITVSPLSVVQVEEIATALQGTKSVFDATIRFNWIVFRGELQEVLALVAHSGVSVLQLDGLTSKARIHNFENEEDLFVDIVGSSTLQPVTLLNYPRLSEQYLYLGRADSDVFGLQLSRPAELRHFDWFNMRMTLERGLDRITGKMTRTSLIQPSLQEIFHQLVIEKDLSVRGIDLFEPESKMWQGRLGVQGSVVFGLSDTIAPSTMLCQSLLEYGTLRSLRLTTQDSVDIPYLFSLIELNPGLQYFDIPAQEERIFKYLRPLWRKSATGQFQVVLRELSAENVLHRIASLVIGASCPKSSSADSFGLPMVDVLRWRCDYVSGLRADQDARVLDIVTQKFSSVITNLTLNLSAFTRSGLFGIQEVLQRSSLERLVIHCPHFDPSLREHFGQVLNSVQWPTINSLTLIGDKIDDWIRVWAEMGNLFGASSSLLGPRLSCMDIIGTNSGDPISRFSALSLHRLIYSSCLVQVCLENIRLQDDSDWDLIIGAIDFATLNSLSFLNSAFVNMVILVDRLKEQLSDLGLIVFTSSREDKLLTLVSSLTNSVIGNAVQCHELDIKGIDMGQTKDIWHTLAPVSEGFQYGLVRAINPSDPSSPRALRSGTLCRALARPSRLSHLYYFRSITNRVSGLQRITLPTRKDSFSNLHQRLQHSAVTSLDMSVAGTRWYKSSSGVDGGISDPNIKASVDDASVDMNSLSMTDNIAALLDASSARHPLALTTLDLDIAYLTKQGLSSLRSVLQRSTLDHLKISCVHISEEMWDDVFQLLKSLRPATLKSLVLVGDNIDEWLWLWVKGCNHPSLHGSMADPSFLCPILQKLEIRGDRRLQMLGHKSAMMVRHLIQSSHLQELCLRLIQFVRDDDWDHIAGTIEKSGVTTLVMSSELKAMMKQHFWYHFRQKMIRDDAVINNKHNYHLK
ncbi:hypothetical protein BG000_007172 [Podila horticola]|nr:hypothetical protein BG000_007172 [Podila horticola]